jgi:hypothetical protein
MLNRFKTILVSALGALALMAAAPSASATGLEITLAPIIVEPGQTGITILGTITNQYGDVVYFNGDSENLADTIAAPASVNDDDFFANVPVSLDNGATTGQIALFTFDVLPDAPYGTIDVGSFSVFGGIGTSNQANFDFLGSQDLTVNVVPEPSGASYLMIGLGLLAVFAVPRILRARP